MKKDNNYYINLAINLALKAKGLTSPNPMVGALVVKNGRIVGRGFHERAGGPHAEVIALEQAGKEAKGAALYVTLEPCAHFGKTPPCVQKIIQCGIKKVVAGTVDPNPLNNGKGLKILKDYKIKVESGFCQDRLYKLNEVFFKYITKRMPFITVKIAQSLDGKIATRTGDSKWITSDKSRGWAHRQRQYYDAIMVGVNTVLRDNPRLEPWFARRKPLKVIVDSKLSTPANADIFLSNSKVIIATLAVKPGQETENRQVLAGKASLLEVKEKHGQVNLKDLLKKLAAMEISSILVEGGGTLIGSLFDEKLVDKVLFFISPKIIGGKDAIGSVMGSGISRVDSAYKLKEVKLHRFQEDILVEGYL